MGKIFVDPSLDFNPYRLYTYVEDFKSSEEYRRLIKLEKYYMSNNVAIMNRKKSLNDDINNKLISGYPRYITSMTTGYFAGGKDSITYIFPTKNECIDNSFRYNDEKAVTTNLAKNAAIYGYAVEQYFIDNNGEFRFKDISPMNTILLFEDNIDEDLLAVIKFRNYTYKKHDGNEAEKTVLEYYTKEMYNEYTYIDGVFKPDNTIEEINVFSDVPFTYYENPDRLGDFESVLTLIDAYDQALSDNSNLFEYYNDCYLVFKGCQFMEEKELKLKDMKGLNLPAEADVSFLKKPEVTGDLMNYLETLRKDIHKYSLVPDLTDKDYLNAASGTSMRLKLQGLEFLTGIKENNFRKGLTRRLEILGNFLSLSNNSFEFDKALITFKRNTVESLSEILNDAIRLKGIISDQSLLDMIPVVDTDEELKRLEEQKEKNIAEFNMQNNIDPFFNKDDQEEEDEDPKKVDDQDEQ